MYIDKLIYEEYKDCAMPFCPNCGKEVSTDTNFCPDCGRQLSIGQDTKGNVTYNKALRWISGVFGLFSLIVGVGGLTFFVVSGLVSELIVDIISIAVGVALLLIAIVPNWVRSTSRIKLEKGSVFGGVMAVLVIVVFVANALGPVPPEGWWNY